MKNYFEGFGLFCEDNFLSLMKHQFPVTLKSFENMSITIPAGYQFGKTKLSMATNFFVQKVDDDEVTISSVPPKAVPDSEWDADEESDRTDGDLPETMIFTISKKEFSNLLTPPNPQEQGMS